MKNAFNLISVILIFGFFTDANALNSPSSRNGYLSANQLEACYKDPKTLFCKAYVAGLKDGLIYGVNMDWAMPRNISISTETMMRILRKRIKLGPILGDMFAPTAIMIALSEEGIIKERAQLEEKNK